jgi:hypothetical protein
MNYLLPKFHPAAKVFIAVFYVLCLIYGDLNTNTEVLFASPGAATQALPYIALGTAMLFGGIKAGLDAKRDREALEAQQKAERDRIKGVEEGFAPLLEEAEERRADPESYELSEAQKRERLAQVQKDLEAQTKDAETQLIRGAQLPYGSGKQFQMMDALQKRRSDALAGARLGIERESDYLAEAKKRADDALLIDYTKTRAGMPTTTPQFESFGSRLLGTLGGGLLAGAQMGAFGEFGGGGTKTGTPPPTDPGDPAIDNPANVGDVPLIYDV